MPHVTYIVTDPLTVKVYLTPQVQALVGQNWQVTIICGGNKALLSGLDELQGVAVHHVPMCREIDAISDSLALVQLFLLLSRLRPALVIAGTPKAGLLGMVASRVARIPLRIYQLHGLRLETATGWRRRLFLLTERAACSCSHKVLCVSKSLSDKVVELGLCKPEKVAVLGFGSCTGISVADYAPTAERLAAASGLKNRLKIPPGAPVVGYIGRLTKDKGIVELWDAFALIQRRLCDAYLLLIGPFEQGDPIPEHTRLQIDQDKHVRHIDWTDDPASYLHLMDVLVLPTHREGLPGVLLEAAATETPIVATCATGVIDVIVNDETGLVSPIGDARSIAGNVVKILTNPALARELSGRALRKVETEFSRSVVLKHLVSFCENAVFHGGVSGAPDRRHDLREHEMPPPVAPPS